MLPVFQEYPFLIAPSVYLWTISSHSHIWAKSSQNRFVQVKCTNIQVIL
jgi:hypothetical protein